MLGLVLVYGGVLAYLTVWAVLWAWYGAPAFGLLVFLPLALALGAVGPYRMAVRLVGAEVATSGDEPQLHARGCLTGSAPLQTSPSHGSTSHRRTCRRRLRSESGRAAP